MNSISLRRRLVAVLLLPFLMVLAGCGKIHADFEIKDAETINAVFDIAMDTTFAEGTWDSAESFCEEMQGETTLGEDAPTVEPYEKNGQYGCVITGVLTSDDFDSDFNLTEEDGEFHLVMTGGASAADLAGAEDLGLDFRMTFTFPGEIIESSGGEIDGNTVTFTDVNTLTNGIDIRADAGGFPWIIVIVVVLVLGFLFLLLLAAIAFFVIRARKNKNKGGGSSPSGMPGGYGAAAAAPQGQQSQQSQQSQQGQPWGQQGQPWGQASPPPAPQAPQSEQPWSQPPQDGQQWGQPDQNQPDQGQPGQGQQPPRNPGW